MLRSIRRQSWAGPTRLLNHVDELVRDEATPLVCARSVLTVVESDRCANRVGTRTQGTCRGLGIGIRVDAHVAEVVSEAGLHLGPQSGIERLPGAGWLPGI